MVRWSVLSWIHIYVTEYTLLFAQVRPALVWQLALQLFNMSDIMSAVIYS